MGMTIIEVLTASGQVKSTHRIESLPATIGRGYTSDVILHDPHIASCHARITQTENGFLVHDMNTINKIRDEKGNNVGSVHKISSGDRFFLGKTMICLYNADHEVSPELPINRIPGFFRSAGSLIPAALSMLLCLIVLMAGLYLNETGKVKMLDLFTQSALMMFLPVIWAIVLSFIGRVMKHQIAFGIHLTLAAVYVVIIRAGVECVSVFEYMTNSAVLASVSMLVFIGVTTSALLFIETGIVSFLTIKLRMLVSSALVWIPVAIIMLARYSGINDYKAVPQYSLVIKPPVFQITKPLSIDEFIDDVRNDMDAAVDSTDESTDLSATVK